MMILFLHSFLIICLSVKINLPLKLQTVHFSVVEQTYKVNRASETYFPHCNCTVFDSRYKKPTDFKRKKLQLLTKKPLYLHLHQTLHKDS